MPKPKKVYPIPPCPTYDLRTTQVWLEDMAKEGLFLKKFIYLGIYTICAVFEERAPKAVRYRLDAANDIVATFIWTMFQCTDTVTPTLFS